MDRSGINPAGSAYPLLAYFPPLLALTGFALAQPVYDLILSAPEFLVARQNTRTDLWLLAVALNGLLPLLLALAVYLVSKVHEAAGRACFAGISYLLAALFFAQLANAAPGASLSLFVPVVAAAAFLVTAALLHERLQILGWVLAVLSISFPILFLLQVPELEYGEGFRLGKTAVQAPRGQLPPVVVVIADELPLSSLLDGNGDIDPGLFPNIYRLQQSANWYRDTTSVADGTAEAVPAILTGNYPGLGNMPATIATAPVNLFTLLQGQYRLNVAESVTRLCPRAHCPVYAPPGHSRIKALFLDLAALYLHRVLPANYSYLLPDVSYGWSGFFAQKQQFFPGGWLEFAQGQATVNRPEMFRQFIKSLGQQQQPSLNFLHILYPHVPFAYLPDGRNYGDHWLRGLEKEEWYDTSWGVLNSRQRYTLQLQHFDKLIGDMLDKLQSLDLLDKSLVVLVADHGVAFRAKDRRRALSETNIAEILRVPLLIKKPKQTSARIFDAPVMTIDILPTVLGMLGYDAGNTGFDGLNLEDQLPDPGRQRQALSFKHREYQTFAAKQLDIGPVIAENRAQLALDDTGKGLWSIGPFAAYHGLSLGSLCTPASSNVRSISGQNKPLPGTENEVFIPAFVSGRFDGELEAGQTYRFVITVDDIIVASGETWEFRGAHLYFAMVNPQYIAASDWRPKAWLYTPGGCLGYPPDS